MLHRAIIILFTLALAGCFPKMRDTKVPSSNGSYEKLSSEATKLGWQAEYKDKGGHDGSHFWMLKVTTKDGGLIYFTKNNATGNVAFSCGGALSSGKPCEDAANQLFEPAFGARY